MTTFQMLALFDEHFLNEGFCWRTLYVGLGHTVQVEIFIQLKLHKSSQSLKPLGPS